MIVDELSEIVPETIPIGMRFEAVVRLYPRATTVGELFGRGAERQAHHQGPRRADSVDGIP
jgi:hypothetical protein